MKGYAEKSRRIRFRSLVRHRHYARQASHRCRRPDGQGHAGRHRFPRRPGYSQRRASASPISPTTALSKSNEGSDGGIDDLNGYKLDRRIEVTSKDLDGISKLSGAAPVLLRDGIEISFNATEYYCTQLADLKVIMLGEAVQDAQRRAEEIAGKSNRKIGSLRSAKLRVFSRSRRSTPPKLPAKALSIRPLRERKASRPLSPPSSNSINRAGSATRNLQSVSSTSSRAYPAWSQTSRARHPTEPVWRTWITRMTIVLYRRPQSQFFRCLRRVRAVQPIRNPQNSTPESSRAFVKRAQATS